MSVTAAEVARSVGIGPRSKRFVLRDQDGVAYDGGRSELVLAALSRSDKSELPAEVHTVAYAVRKSLVTARMQAMFAMRLRSMSPYQVCGLVAAVARECPETTTGGICDGWLPGNIARLVGEQ
jgi:hypothetical protein